MPIWADGDLLTPNNLNSQSVTDLTTVGDLTVGGDAVVGTTIITTFTPTFTVDGTNPALIVRDSATAVDY